MATANFYLEKSRGKEPEAQIFLYFRFSGNTLKYATGQKIDPVHWDANKQRAKKSAGVSMWAELNQYLSFIESTIHSIYKGMVYALQNPTTKALKAELMNRIGKTPASERITLFGYIDKFIANNLTSKSPLTIKRYKSTLAHLKAFEIHSRKPVDFHTLDIQFYNDFTAYLTHTVRQKPNTVGSYIKNLKVFLNSATEVLPEGSVGSQYKSKYFKTITAASDSIYLSEAELDAIGSVDLSANLRLDKVRDLFLVGCYTGLRFSDFTTISQANIQDKLLVIHTMKTQQKVYIPIHRAVTAILNKYNGEMPKAISNQKMNDYLKELGKLAGIDTPIERINEFGGRKEKTITPKYLLISTHTARRSFATNAYLAGVPSLAIMAITGHKKETTFLKYVKVTKQEQAYHAAKHPFFKK